MIRFVAAIDSKRGLANEHGIPWQGKLPTDVQHFRNITSHSTILMGYGTYREFHRPLPNRQNYVATTANQVLREGFERVTDAREFIGSALEDIWVIGGASLFAGTIDLADELHLTILDGDFECTKYFPEYKEDFTLVKKSEPQTENGIKFWYEVWKSK